LPRICSAQAATGMTGAEYRGKGPYSRIVPQHQRRTRTTNCVTDELNDGNVDSAASLQPEDMGEAVGL
jgi:hypothetical protein